MSEIQVEVCFYGQAEVCPRGRKGDGNPKAVKAKPVEEWFEPAAGRVKWGGLGAEIKEMDFNGEKDATYSFLFNGPEDKKQEFMECVERFCLGEEAQQETKKKTVQDYLQEAKKNQQAGNAEMAFQQYMVAARDYGHPEAQFKVARCYQNGTGVKKSEGKMRSCGTKRPQSSAMPRHSVHWASAIIRLVALKRTTKRPADGTKRRRLREM